MDIVEEKIYRKAIPYHLGSTPNSKLSFSISAFSEEDLDADMVARIEKAYFSHRTYKPFMIYQPDLEDVYWLAILQDPRFHKIGNIAKGVSFTVSCNAPYGFHYPHQTAWTFTDPTVDQTVIFNNTSDDSGDYLLPQLVITMNNTADADLSITNSDDGNRNFVFTDLSQNEVIIMDCYRQTLSSSTGLRRLSKFNKKYLRLVNGLNHLRIQGNVASIVMTTQFISKKI
jgi:phage-related protein